VTLTTPSDGTSYTAPAAVVLSATASDPENALDRVEFYSGATLIGAATAAPYSFTWSPVGAGTYTIRAVAYDAAGASATSATSSITVSAPNAPPTVTLSTPASGATYTAPATVVLSADASDPENAVARVEFYSGSTLLGTATAAPYSFTWGSVPAGTYNVRAVAYDAAGASASSAAVTIIVTIPVVTPPTGVAFTASVDQASVTSYELRIYASGANPATAMAIATSDLGKPAPDANGDITVDCATFFSNLGVGDYVAAVAAIAAGGASVSTGVTFTR
jgi:predicted phage tail protein